MKKRYIAVAVSVLSVLGVGVLMVVLSGFIPLNGSSQIPTPTLTLTPSSTSSPTASPMPTPTPSISNGTITYTYQIVNTYPHDPNAFTEGLVFENGVLYESTGVYGDSSVRRVDLTSGHVTREFILPDTFFGEGLTVVNDSLVQLTWQSNVGFVYNRETFEVVRNFSYSTEGWGLTYDGHQLIMSDGTSNLYFLDPVTFLKIGQVNVLDGKTPVTNINELEFVNGDLYANIWLQQKIAIINPKTGMVKSWIDLTEIYQSNNMDAVLNGIAYDSKTDRLFITGKYWSNLYQITITPTK